VYDSIEWCLKFAILLRQRRARSCHYPSPGPSPPVLSAPAQNEVKACSTTTMRWFDFLSTRETVVPCTTLIDRFSFLSIIDNEEIL
jgi:hypothetical protein